jgi:hypothetical protein
MNTHPCPARHIPSPPVPLAEIAGLGREIAAAGYCEHCDLLITRIAAHLARFATQVYEFRSALAAERLRSANLEAAIRAALSAYDDGETDPLAYLRDEIPGNDGAAYGP